jgi:hypothetical protein
VTSRGIFFEEDDARAAAAQLSTQGYQAHVARDRLAGEDDDEDQPWSVTTDAPDVVLEMLVEEHDGWFEGAEAARPAPPLPPLQLPTAPKRIKRPD